MDSSTGKIYKMSNDEEMAELQKVLGRKLTGLTDKENGILQNLAEADRPEALALSRFGEERKRLKAPYNQAIQNAFRLGYKAGVKDRT